MTIELTEDEFKLLVLALGTAAAVAGSSALRNRLIRLANTVNRDNPNWTPHEVGE